VPLLRTLGEEFVITGWAAMYASRAVPVAGVERFSTLMRNALGEAGVRERFAAFGVTPEPTTPAQLREFTRGEIARWGDVVRSRGITLS
jgi:tripartite-type tricarboxylate transporter receptor subunit TctC